MRFAWVLAVALSLSGCEGVAVTSPRYSGASEVAEIPLGILALPFAIVLDVFVELLFLQNGSLTLDALTLLNPLCNGIEGTPSEVPGVSDGVEVERTGFELEVPVSRGIVRHNVREWLREKKFFVDLDTRERVGTSWRAPPRGSKPAIHETVLVEIDRNEDDTTTIRLSQHLGASASELGGPETDEEKLRRWTLEGERDALKCESDRAGERRQIEYLSHGERRKDEIRSEVDAERAPLDDARSSAQNDIDAEKDAVFTRQVLATRQVLEKRRLVTLEELETELGKRFPGTKRRPALPRR